MLVLMTTGCQESTIIVPKESIRFRVIANSNTDYDQSTKQKVRNEIQNEMMKNLKNTKTIEEARENIEKNIEEYSTIVQDTLNKNDINIPFQINYGQNYFPEKHYKGVTYQEGYYESLVITLGEGKGENWWCILFPPLCLLETEESDKNEVEYKFFIKEIIDKYF